MALRKVALLAMLSLLVLSIATGSGVFGLRTAVFAQSGNSSTLPTPPTCGLNPGNPCGQPSFANLTAMGNAYAIMIEQTAQFKAFANGTTYHVDNSSSFGYEWGPTIPSEETVTLFSPNRMAYITAYVFVSNSTIQSMSFTNDSSLGIVYPGSTPGNSTSSSLYWPDMIALSLGVALATTLLAVVLLACRRSTSDGVSVASSEAGAALEGQYHRLCQAQYFEGTRPFIGSSINHFGNMSFLIIRPNLF